jgi:hypothetical protein
VGNSGQELRSITLITTPAAAGRVIQGLHDEGIDTAAAQRARGSAIGDPVDRSGLPLQQEKEIISVVVPAEMADDIFQLLFRLSSLEDPRGGFLYMAKLGKASQYRLPEIARKPS